MASGLKRLTLPNMASGLNKVTLLTASGLDRVTLLTWPPALTGNVTLNTASGRNR